MKNNDKAYVWSCNDFSEEEAKLEKFACRLQNVESKYWEWFTWLCSLDATHFKEAFEAAKTFNLNVKEGKNDDLVYAAVVEDKEEPVDPTDDPDKNHTADADGGAEGADDKEWISELNVSN
jgi:hypothetical protein